MKKIDDNFLQKISGGNEDISDRRRSITVGLAVMSTLTGLGWHDFYNGRIGRGFSKLIPIYGLCANLGDTFNALGGGYKDDEGKKVKKW